MNSSEPVGTVRALWRFPVKSMLGEQLDVVEVGDGGMAGDRGYAVRDRETGKVASAKHPKLWPGLLSCRAAFVEPPRPRQELPPVRIDLADGESVLSDASDSDAILSRFFGRDVELARAAQSGYTIDADVRRFRMNVIVDTPASGFVENEWPGAAHDWRRVQLGVALPDPRCVMPSLPRRTFRRTPHLRPSPSTTGSTSRVLGTLRGRPRRGKQRARSGDDTVSLV
jgi:uncharacterized protein YcbX